MNTYKHGLDKSKREMGIATPKRPKIDKNYRNPAYAQLSEDRVKSKNEWQEKKMEKALGGKIVSVKHNKAKK